MTSAAHPVTRSKPVFRPDGVAKLQHGGMLEGSTYTVVSGLNDAASDTVPAVVMLASKPPTQKAQDNDEYGSRLLGSVEEVRFIVFRQVVTPSAISVCDKM